MYSIEREIFSHLGSSDLDLASEILDTLVSSEAVSRGDFTDWLVDKINDDNFNISHLIAGHDDIVALMYEFAINKLGYETPITEYIHCTAMENLCGNYLATNIDYDLSEDDEFKKLVKKHSKGKNIVQRLKNHFEENDINLQLANWVLFEMGIQLI